MYADGTKPLNQFFRIKYIKIEHLYIYFAIPHYFYMKIQYATFNGSKVNIENISRESYYSADKENYKMRNKLFCPLCNGKLIPKLGNIVIHHFSHKANSSCDSWMSNMTKWHLKWQSFFKDDYKEVVIKKHTSNGTVRRHFADIKTKDGIVIEIQHSNISKENITKREEFYGDMIWILDSTNHECDKCILEDTSESTSEKCSCQNRLKSIYHGTNFAILNFINIPTYGLMKKPVYIHTNEGLFQIVKQRNRSWDDNDKWPKDHKKYILCKKVNYDIFIKKFFQNSIKDTIQKNKLIDWFNYKHYNSLKSYDDQIENLSLIQNKGDGYHFHIQNIKVNLDSLFHYDTDLKDPVYLNDLTTVEKCDKMINELERSSQSVDYRINNKICKKIGSDSRALFDKIMYYTEWGCWNTNNSKCILRNTNNDHKLKNKINSKIDCVHKHMNALYKTAWYLKWISFFKNEYIVSQAENSDIHNTFVDVENIKGKTIKIIDYDITEYDINKYEKRYPDLVWLINLTNSKNKKKLISIIHGSNFVILKAINFNMFSAMNKPGFIHTNESLFEVDFIFKSNQDYDNDYYTYILCYEIVRIDYVSATLGLKNSHSNEFNNWIKPNNFLKNYQIFDDPRVFKLNSFDFCANLNFENKIIYDLILEGIIKKVNNINTFVDLSAHKALIQDISFNTEAYIIEIINKACSDAQSSDLNTVFKKYLCYNGDGNWSYDPKKVDNASKTLDLVGNSDDLINDVTKLIYDQFGIIDDRFQTILGPCAKPHHAIYNLGSRKIYQNVDDMNTLVDLKEYKDVIHDVDFDIEAYIAGIVEREYCYASNLKSRIIFKEYLDHYIYGSWSYGPKRLKYDTKFKILDMVENLDSLKNNFSKFISEQLILIENRIKDIQDSNNESESDQEV